MNECISPEMVWTESVHACDSEIRWDPETEWDILSSPSGTCCIWYRLIISLSFCSLAYWAWGQCCSAPHRSIKTKLWWNMKPTLDFSLPFSCCFAWLITTDNMKIFKVYLDSWWIQYYIIYYFMKAEQTFVTNLRNKTDFIHITWIISQPITPPLTSSCGCLVGLGPEAENLLRIIPLSPSLSASLSRRHLSKCHDGLPRPNSKVSPFPS